MKQRDERRRFWTAVVARFEGSGKSRKEFAAEAGVGLAIFQDRLYKFRRERAVQPRLLPDRGGFVLYYERLERGRFRLPRIPADATSVGIDATELAMLLHGIGVLAVKRPRKWEPTPLAIGAPAATIWSFWPPVEIHLPRIQCVPRGQDI